MFLASLVLSSCGGSVDTSANFRYPSQPAIKSSKPASSTQLKNLGYVIQAGAFSSIDNAVRFEQTLDSKGLDAYYYREKVNGRWFYRVRFGNFSSKIEATNKAENLVYNGIIDTYFIVSPNSFTVRKSKINSKTNIRNEIVRTAKKYIGIPYKWGGTSSRTGFDCSGLTMVTYRLNGINLPRVSRNQFKYGKKITKRNLQKGDLVFFATSGGRRVSHVGIYIGGGKFIHAPATGKRIKIARLNSSYFRKRYVGSRSYL
jgi:hypothetical protein